MMPAAAEQLDFIAAGLADCPALAKFTSRMSISGSGDEVVVTFGGRNLSIRVSGQSVVVGGDEIALGNDAQETLGRVASRLAQRLTQMDG
jgi:galactose mutarotase-like enzyme